MNRRKGIKNIGLRNIPAQDEVIPSKAERMSKNEAGGMTFKQSIVTKFFRALLTIASPTYYVKEEDIYQRQLNIFKEMYDSYGIEAYIKLIEYASKVAFRPHGIILALVWAINNVKENDKRKIVELFDPQRGVIKSLNYLYQFIELNKQLYAKSSSAKRRAINTWILGCYKQGNFEYQSAKFFQRSGWSIFDVLRISHPKFNEEGFSKIVEDIKAKAKELKNYEYKTKFFKIWAEIRNLALQNRVKEIANLIVTHNIPRELVPDNVRKEIEILKALMKTSPSLSFIKMIPELATYGVLVPNCEKETINFVEERIKKCAEVLHPIDLGIMALVYPKGTSMRRNWIPIEGIAKTLSEATMQAFIRYKLSKDNPFKGKKVFIAVDTSGSMRGGDVQGTGLYPIEIASIFAKLIGYLSDSYVSGTFSNRFIPYTFDFTASIENVLEQLYEANCCCSTDMSSAIKYLIDKKIRVDAMFFITDDQTWEGYNVDALLDYYRKIFNKNCICVTINVVPAYENQAFDPEHPLNFWFNGFDAGIVKVIEEAIAGRLTSDYLHKLIKS